VDLFAKEWKDDGSEGPVDLKDLRSLSQRIRYEAGSEFASDARGDVILSNVKLAPEGDDKLGYRVMLQMMQLNGMPVYVTKGSSGYKLVPHSNAGIARVVLDKVAEGDLTSARRWLDWAREENSVQGGEDPLAGSVFPRVWRRGQNGDAVAIQVAAAALLADHKQQEKLLPVLKAAREGAKTESEKANLDLILFDAYATLKRWPEALGAMAEVLRFYPDSDAAFTGYTYAAINLKDWDAVNRAAKQRTERNPDDELVLMVEAEAAAKRGNVQESLDLLKPRISNPKAGMSLLNNYAWTGLFLSPVPADAVEIAQRAARLTENKSFGIVHTLAAVYADMGRLAEARKLILEVMDGSDLDEPNEAAWYVFGRIAEQYGQPEAALEAYRRTKPKKPEEFGASTSTWALAQHRAQVMGAHLE